MSRVIALTDAGRLGFHVSLIKDCIQTKAAALLVLTGFPFVLVVEETYFLRLLAALS